MGKRIKDLTSLSLPINDNDKIIIERSDKSYNANISDILSTKQDTISDLDTIRSGAALGATALQSVPSEYVTETELTSKNFATVSGVDAKINALDATISGNSTHVTIKITEENGKLTSLNVTESDIASANDLESVSSTVTTIQNSVGENTSSKTLSERVNILENKCDKLDSKANVLWVGTSIPAGNVVDGVPNNYPQMVADALGFNLYNNSIGASFVTFYPNNGYVNDESYNWQKKADIKEYVGYCLSATKQQVEDKFRPILQRIKSNDSTMTDADIEHYIGVWKWASYEDRIIPYIDGTKASCDTVIIDHGYNDRDNIVGSAGNYADETLDYSSLKDDENDNHTPLERYMYDMKDVEVSRLSNKSPIEYASWLDDVFLHETTRKVNGDSTVLIENQLFDVPSVYIGIRVIIRYNPRTFEGTYLYDVSQKKKVPLKRTDRVENGRTRREEIIY